MHGANYRTGNGQPYTRKQYIKGKPQIKIAKFASGQRSDMTTVYNSVQMRKPR